MASPSSPWFLDPNSGKEARLRVFGFPFAGSGASYFSRWNTRFPSDLAITGVQLPGRETRFREPPFQEIGEAAAALLPHLAPCMRDKPCVFFGHSMGAKLALEVTRSLAAAGGPMPLALIVSGSRPPHLLDTRPPLHDLPEGQFLDALRKYNGTSEAILTNRELLDLYLPVLRADFKMDRMYHVPRPEPLPIPLLALGGEADHDAKVGDIGEWAAFAGAGYRVRIFPGGHFFLNDHLDEVVDEVAETSRTAHACAV